MLRTINNNAKDSMALLIFRKNVLFYVPFFIGGFSNVKNSVKKGVFSLKNTPFVERKTGFGPATFALARRRSTTEPLPQRIRKALKHEPNIIQRLTDLNIIVKQMRAHFL